MLYDVPENQWNLSDPILQLLERLFTRKISGARYTLACTHAGTVLMDGVLMRLSDGIFGM